MPIYRHSTWTNYEEGDVSDADCVVRMDGPEIIVEYQHSPGRRLYYKGFAVGEGHYELDNPQVQGTATLHLTPGGSILEGSWREGGVRGMWKIELSDEE